MLKNCMRAFAALSVALLSGCASEDMVEPVYEMGEERTIVVLPFRDEGYENDWKSPRGVELAEKVTRLLEEHGREFKAVVPQEKLLEFYDQEKDPKTITPLDVAQRTKADYVIHAVVRSWQHKDPLAVNLYRGTAVVDLVLWEHPRIAIEKGVKADSKAGRQGRPVWRNPVTAHFPDEYGLGDVGVEMVGHSEDWIDDGLKGAVAKKVAQLFYAHDKEKKQLTQE